MKTKNIYNLIILDESGSMTAIERQAVSAMNETFQGIRNASKANPEQNFFVSLAYDAVNLYKMAAEKEGSVEKAAVRDAMRTLRNVKGSHGLTYNVAKNGQTLNELFIIQIQDNKAVVIDKAVNENVEFD